MSWFDDYWTALKGVIGAAWTDVQPGALFSDTAASKRDWPNLINGGVMTPPWVVVKVDPQPTDEWGVGQPRFDVAATVNYIAADNAVDGTSAKITPFILGKLIALQSALLTDDTIPGTILTQMVLNANTDGPVEAGMLSADQRFSAGSLMFHTIVVVTG